MDAALRSNAVFLLGAYLLLVERYTLDRSLYHSALRMLTYADVCGRLRLRMLTYADVCGRSGTRSTGRFTTLRLLSFLL
jgi:hypothetical protein